MTLQALSNETQEVREGMVRIPEGYFWMGAENGSDAERPIHRVWLPHYWIDDAPVTNRQFGAFTDATGYKTTAESIRKDSRAERLCWRGFANQERADHPVVMVSWIDAEMFAEWIGKRLPSEAEWEKAARGGLEQALYPWGDEAPDQSHACWLQSQGKLNVSPTTPVRSFPANPYGVYDMAGNIWQWCHDWYDDHYYHASQDNNPKGPATGQFRTRRGAAWNVREPFRLRCANRGAMPPGSFWPNLGFRCARGES